MRRINLLSEETSNKIAAGEVIERPSSVVKELIENSIDAGSKTIGIEVENGGETLIRIVDDGVGIYGDDIEKAFMPHATSKISKIEDIYSINTLGFRGEALPSIASVSNTILRSKIRESEFGREISISGGSINYVKDCGCSIGTTIEVRNLFYNVPARAKFLKSPQKEMAAISDIVNRLALSHSSISFKLINGGKKSITTYSTDKLIDTIREIYGKKIVDNVVYFERHSDLVSVHGYVGNAEISRGSRNNQSIFINNRYIKNRLITTAIENAVKSFTMINKFPFFIIFLDIFPEFVDVNVHPTKSEIKFRNEREIFKIVFDTVHEALRESVKDSFKIDAVVKEENAINELKNDVRDENINVVQLPIDLKNSVDEQKVQEAQNDNITYKLETSYSKPENKAVPSYDFVKESKNEEKPVLKKEPKFEKLRVIGQFDNTYILAEGVKSFYIIDQHAAHEKVLFEKYRNEIKDRSVVSQIMITPAVIELIPSDYVYYIENKHIFENAGFKSEDFGDNTIIIKEVPMFLGKPYAKDMFLNILDNLKDMGSGETIEVKYMKIATLACKAAIKAYNELSMAEMEKLVDDLRYLDDPFNCPHGRPTIIKYTITDFEKRFKRIQ
ncbi:DNA mismatch repair endonuclease MutL [Clostridium guangxiense]|uniref:DNA mismatch repair endonuclease MutL n=1 Tax=Clostridium guangxiense TaxID=1662055 RepID=UPI001E335D48|nr:DNA mismatch repair endonuclease MutL [Clostridium guangxiense]MCD2345926.1 DNA mismatch repair endonuclease MutL [Clostridium guangxiense]